jgi:DNA-binding transcriptional ArsR family regulator
MLPSSGDGSAGLESDPRVIGLDSDEADTALSALSSTTARRILGLLHDRPDTPASVADRADTTLQNAQYHLGRMSEAGLVEVVDTVYSEKGREMKVYAPADRPLVVFAGPDEESEGLRATLSRLLGVVGLLALTSLIVQVALRGVPALPFGARTGAAQGGGDGGGGAVATQDATVESAAAAETALGLPPGLLFLLGGLTVLLVVVAVRVVRARRAGE